MRNVSFHNCEVLDHILYLFHETYNYIFHSIVRDQLIHKYTCRSDGYLPRGIL